MAGPQPTRILVIGDIHLGRLPSRTSEADLDPKQLSSVVAWKRAVDRALRESVHAVLLAGDVVDHEDDRFEAYGVLEEGVRRLTEAGVRVLGVAGNHDHVAFPRLAERLDGFHLLGARGRWELFDLVERVPVPAQILGWSFPERHFPNSPLESGGLETALAARQDRLACLGLLHADLDAGRSRYAPVNRAELERAPTDAWFLGHVHKPSDLTGARPIGYLGSIVGLGRGETGPHGPWLVEVRGPGEVSARMLPLGPIEWLGVDVDVSDLATNHNTKDALHIGIERVFRARHAERQERPDDGIEVVAVSVRLTGRTERGQEIRHCLEQMSPTDLKFLLGSQTWFATTVIDDTRPAVDLQALARQQNPAGVLAQLILTLESEDPVPDGLRTRLEGIRRDRPREEEIDKDAPPPPSVEDRAHRMAMEALERLLSQSAAGDQA